MCAFFTIDFRNCKSQYTDGLIKNYKNIVTVLSLGAPIYIIPSQKHNGRRKQLWVRMCI